MEGMIGEIRMFGGNFAPRAWAFCEGQLLAISTHTALFSILGTIYGGDGRTTFALPDLRGRTPIGPGNGPGLPSYREGEKSGATTVTVTVANMPNHNHMASLKSSVTGTGGSPTNMQFAPASGRNASGAVQVTAYDSTTESTMAGDAVTFSNTGGSQSVNNMMPSIAIYYVICMQGVFPSRG